MKQDSRSFNEAESPFFIFSVFSIEIAAFGATNERLTHTNTRLRP